MIKSRRIETWECTHFACLVSTTVLNISDGALKIPLHAVFGCFYIGLSGPLILYLKSLSRNSALVQNYSHYEQSHNELSSGCAVSVSVALNAMRKKEAGLTAMLWSFASHDV